MNRITQLDPEQATGKVSELFGGVKRKLGAVPNLFRVLGTAPAALQGYIDFGGALAGGSLDATVREQIALAVAESNLCVYCLSAHSFLAGKVGLRADEIRDARRAMAAAERTDAILKLARGIVLKRGDITDADFAKARQAGLTDGEIVETVANVALNIFTNYVNHVAHTVVDFPEVAGARRA